VRHEAATWLAVLSLVACGAAPDSPVKPTSISVGTAAASNQSLRRSIDQMPRSFDPALITDTPAQRITDDLFEGLTTLAVDGTVAPGVAKSWEVSQDGKTWLFHLREARWSNGEPITAADFIYAWQRVVNPKTAADYAQTLAPIKNALQITEGKLPPAALGATALDAHTVRIELEAPTPYVLTLLTGNFMMPLHRATLERWGDDWVAPAHMVSNGPFILAEVIIGNRIRLKKNPYYWAADSVQLSEVTYYPLDRPIQNSRFLAGDLDFTDAFSAEQYHWLRQQLGDQAVTAPYLGTFMLGMNMKLAPFAGNRALRLALSLAVDREILATRVRQSMYLPAYSLVPPLPGYTSALPAWSRLNDADRHALARRYYAEAGYAPDKPLRVELTYPSDSDNRQVYEALAAMWRVNLGAEIDTYNEEFRVLQQDRRLHQLRLFHWAWLGDYPDPYTFMQTLQTGFGVNDGLYSNAQYDALLQAASAEPNNSRRYQLFSQAEAIINDDAAYIPLYFYACRHLIKPYVKGWQTNILDRNLSRYMVLMQHEGS
jgi:oligopeptide transport system substrate-binding protein